MWNTREIVWELIRGNPNYEQNDKPQSKSDIYKLSMDEKKEIIPERHTEEDVRIFEKMQFNKQ